MAARKNVETENHKKVKNQLEKECKGIPKGKVMSYKALAEKLGTSATTIGTIIKGCRGDDAMCFHRAVPTSGDLSKKSKMTTDTKQKVELLQSEGVEFLRGHVVPKECFVE